MPNHVITYVLCPQLSESEARAILEPLRDFANLIPHPQWVLDADQQYKNEYAMSNPQVPKDWVKLVMSETLYDWQCEHWDTKWSSYEFEYVEGGVRFQTAWRHPWKVIQHLFMIHPDVDFVVHYANEDIGRSLGSYGRENGIEKVYQEFTYGSEEAEDFALRLWRSMPRRTTNGALMFLRRG